MYGRKARKKWVFARFYFKSGQAETVAAQGFAGSLPTFPLFSLSKREKNSIKLYITDEKKWVFGQSMKNVLKRCPNKSLFQFFLGCAILNSPHNHIFSSGDGKITWQRVFSLFTYTHHRGRDCVATMGDTLIARVRLFIGAHSFYISG